MLTCTGDECVCGYEANEVCEVTDRTWTCEHNESYLKLACNKLFYRYGHQLKSGFVYAGISKNDGLLKVGMSHRQCPLCRMDQNRLTYKGLCWSLSAFEHEQRVLASLGDPVRGWEWFGDPDGRLEFMFRHHLLNDVAELNVTFAKMWG